MLYEAMQNLQSTSEKSYGISDLFSTANMTRKTLIITFIWFCITSVYVGLSYFAPSLGKKFNDFSQLCLCRATRWKGTKASQ